LFRINFYAKFFRFLEQAGRQRHLPFCVWTSGALTDFNLDDRDVNQSDRFPWRKYPFVM